MGVPSRTILEKADLSPRVLLICALLVIAAPVAAFAAPFIPTSDSQILERLPFTPSDPAIRDLRTLHSELGREPG